MKKLLSIACLIFWSVTIFAQSAEKKCDICGEVIHGKYFVTEDTAFGGKKFICAKCAKIEDRCFYCNLPIKGGNIQTLPDTRELCERDAKLAVQSEQEAKDICAQVTDDLDRLLARFMTYPSTNVIVSIVNRFYLENLMRSPTAGQVCVTLYGVTCSNPMPGNRLVHTVSILSHLPKERLMAVCAHEYTHAWMAENVPQERNNRTLDRDTVEAFCELVAYKYMESRQYTRQMAIIRENDYTKGKIDVLIAADEKYGFGAVVEWIKNGDDAKLEMDNLGRIRAVSGTYVPRQISPMALLDIPVAKPTPAPTTLILKGISGSGVHRFALINNATLESMEKGKVRLGQTNVTIRCLEISANSVTIQVEGSNEKKQLFLRDTQ